MVPIRFTKPFGGYNPGEIAGFDEERAAEIIDRGVAEAYVEPKGVEPKVKSKDDKKDGEQK